MEEEEETPLCPVCSGETVLLGNLGRTKHYRCRACGWTFNQRNDQ